MNVWREVGFGATLLTALALVACPGADRGGDGGEVGQAEEARADSLVESADTAMAEGAGGETADTTRSGGGEETGATMRGEEGRPESGIEGVATLGPTCPAQEVGEDCPDRPYETVLLIKDAASGSVLERVRSDSTGRFRVALPPGTYVVEPPQRTLLTEPAAEPVRVTVEANRWAEVKVRFDSGVR